MVVSLVTCADRVPITTECQLVMEVLDERPGIRILGLWDGGVDSKALNLCLQNPVQGSPGYLDFFGLHFCGTVLSADAPPGWRVSVDRPDAAAKLSATAVSWSVEPWYRLGLSPGETEVGFRVSMVQWAQHSVCGLSASHERSDGFIIGFGGGCSHECAWVSSREP